MLEFSELFSGECRIILSLPQEANRRTGCVTKAGERIACARGKELRGAGIIFSAIASSPVVHAVGTAYHILRGNGGQEYANNFLETSGLLWCSGWKEDEVQDVICYLKSLAQLNFQKTVLVVTSAIEPVVNQWAKGNFGRLPTGTEISLGEVTEIVIQNGFLIRQRSISFGV